MLSARPRRPNREMVFSELESLSERIDQQRLFLGTDVVLIFIIIARNI
jgi:hypothetical protein